jgi:hypothetical protein
MKCEGCVMGHKWLHGCSIHTHTQQTHRASSIHEGCCYEHSPRCSEQPNDQTCHPLPSSCSQATGLVACEGGPSVGLPAQACQLPASLVFSNSSYTIPMVAFSCPRVMLQSFLNYTAGMSTTLIAYITQPFAQPVPPGTVRAGFKD